MLEHVMKCKTSFTTRDFLLLTCFINTIQFNRILQKKNAVELVRVFDTWL